MLPVVDYELTLGDDGSWRPLRIWISEGLNRPYRAVIDAVTKFTELPDVDALLGVSGELTLMREEPRRLFGIVEEIDYLGFIGDRLAIRVHLVPAFSLLRQCVNSRIWQTKNVQDIVTEVIGAGFENYERSLDVAEISRGTTAGELCVQYRESDHDFVVRLLEDEGISYEFVHEAKSEVLTLRDANTQYVALVNAADMEEFPIIPDRQAEAETESIQTLEWTRVLTSTAVARNDFDWNTPKSPVTGAAAGADELGHVRRIYVHGNRRYTGDDLAMRTEDVRAASALAGKVARGTSNISRLRPGLKIKVMGHGREDLDREYLITKVTHLGAAPDVGDDADEGGYYRNEFECVPSDCTIRPQLDTPRPKVLGPQTAIVTGEASQEINPDEHGRIKIQFHWEEDPSYSETSSCWVRCAQSWAGMNWGAQFIPRIGMEVVVEFLEGDPDRPLVTGCVYNAVNPPPFVLPDDKTQSGIRTQSSPDGEGFNELRFEDAKDSEQIYVHAQKDLEVEVLNDERWKIGNDEFREVGNDRTDKVGNDELHEVGNDRREKIGNDMHLEVGNLQQTSVAGDRKETIEGEATEDVTKTKTISVGDELRLSVDADFKTVVGGGMVQDVTGAYTANVGEDSKVTVDGDSELTATNTAVKGTAKVVLECGSASITLNSSGDIVLKGANIAVNAAGQLTTKGGSIGNN